jgi:hypothetical protein
MKRMRKCNDEIYQLAKDQSVQPFNKRMNGHRSDLTKRMLLPMSQHFVSPEHTLDDFVRSKIYIIDHNPSWKENQRHKRVSLMLLSRRKAATAGSGNNLVSVSLF